MYIYGMKSQLLNHIKQLRLFDIDYKSIVQHINFSQKKNPQKFIYYYSVWKISENNCINISNIKLRGKDFHLDHIIPISIGYKYNINPSIIGHQSNLRIITRYDNLTKGAILTEDSLDKLKEFEIDLNTIPLFKEIIFSIPDSKIDKLTIDNPKSLLYYDNSLE